MALAVGVLLFYGEFWLGKCLAFGDLSAYFLNIVFEYRKAWGDLNFFWSSTLWNGYPLLGNQQFGFFYPPNLVYLLPGGEWQVLTASLVLHHMVMIVGAYVFLRRKVSAVVAVWGAGVYSFMGPTLSVMSMVGNFVALAWLPWFALGLELLRERVNWKRGLFLWFVSYLLFAGGELQLLLIAIPLVFALVMGGEIRKSLVAGFLVLLGLTTQPWLLSFVESFHESARSKGILSAISNGWQLDFPLALSVLFPSSVYSDVTQSAWVSLNGGLFRQNWIQSLYIGCLAFVAVGAWLFQQMKIRWKEILVCGALLALATGDAWLPVAWLEAHVPILKTMRYPVRYTLPVFLMLPLVAGIAIQRQLHAPLRRIQVVVLLVITGGILAWGAQIHPFWSIGEPKNIVWASKILYESSAHLLLLVLVALALLIRSKEWRIRLIHLLLAADLALVVFYAKRSIPMELWGGGTQEFVDQFHLRGRRGVSLVNSEFGDLKKMRRQDTLQVIPNGMGVSALNQLEIERLKVARFGVVNSFLELTPKVPWVLVGDLSQWESTAYFSSLSWNLGIEYFVTLKTTSGMGLHQGIGASWVGDRTFGAVVAQVYRFDRTMSMFSWFDSVDFQGHYEKIKSADYSKYRLAVIDSGSCQLGAHPETTHWVRYSDRRWKVSTGGQVGFLGFRQSLFPGWKAYEDGREVAPMRVNLLNQGLCVEPSVQNVEFRFLPTYLWWQILLLVGSLILLVLIVFGHRRVQRLLGLEVSNG